MGKKSSEHQIVLLGLDGYDGQLQGSKKKFYSRSFPWNERWTYLLIPTHGELQANAKRLVT